MSHVVSHRLRQSLKLSSSSLSSCDQGQRWHTKKTTSKQPMPSGCFINHYRHNWSFTTLQLVRNSPLTPSGIMNYTYNKRYQHSMNLQPFTATNFRRASVILACTWSIASLWCFNRSALWLCAWMVCHNSCFNVLTWRARSRNQGTTPHTKKPVKLNRFGILVS